MAVQGGELGARSLVLSCLVGAVSSIVPMATEFASAPADAARGRQSLVVRLGPEQAAKASVCLCFCLWRQRRGGKGGESAWDVCARA